MTRTALRLAAAALVGAAIGLLRRRPAQGNALVSGGAEAPPGPPSTTPP